MRLFRLLATAAALGALAGAAAAQTVTPLSVKDGSGAPQPLCEYKPDGTNLAGCTVKWVWNGSAWVLEPTGAGAAAGAPRTVVAQDSSTVAGSSTLPAGSNTIGSTMGALNAAGGWTRKAVIGLSATPVLIKASAGQIGKLQCWNSNAGVAYVQTYDSAAPTVGTTPSVPTMIAPNNTGGFTLSLVGDQFNTAISIASTTTAGGTTGQPIDCSVSYN